MFSDSIYRDVTPIIPVRSSISHKFYPLEEVLGRDQSSIYRSLEDEENSGNPPTGPVQRGAGGLSIETSL